MNAKLIAVMAAAALALSSCHHKDLCYIHSHSSGLRVVYDWSQAPEASPAGMCAYFYPTDENDRYLRFDFPGAKGGEIELAAGNYLLISYNNDTEAVQFSGIGNYGTHTAYTRTGDILEPMYGNGVTSSARVENDERVVIAPDGLWGCTEADIEISWHGTEYEHGGWWSRSVSTDSAGNQVITLYPKDLLCHYSYEVRNVTNASHIRRISAAITGMSGAMNLSTGTLDSELVTIPVEGHANAAAEKVIGSFLTFGHDPANAAPHRMYFFVEMDDGSKYSIKGLPNLDVTDQVDNAPDRRHVHIIIDGLNLPDPENTEGDFNPFVDDWGVVEEDLKI